MEIKKSKADGVYYKLGKSYIRVQGYGDGNEITYSKIPNTVKDWDEPMRSEMMDFYNKRYPLIECRICGKKFRRIHAEVTCSPECSWEWKKAYMNKRNNTDVECDCTICGKTFIKKRYQQKYVCSPECAKEFGKAHDGKIDRTKKKKKSQLVNIEREARAKGLYYADIQKQKTLAMVGGVKL